MLTRLRTFKLFQLKVGKILLLARGRPKLQKLQKILWGITFKRLKISLWNFQESFLLWKGWSLPNFSKTWNSDLEWNVPHNQSLFYRPYSQSWFPIFPSFEVKCTSKRALTLLFLEWVELILMFNNFSTLMNLNSLAKQGLYIYIYIYIAVAVQGWLWVRLELMAW